MTFIQKTHSRNVIRKVAKQHGISTAQCRAEMAACIAEAWATSDPEIKRRHIQLVGEERVPTPEEFLHLISQKLK